MFNKLIHLESTYIIFKYVLSQYFLAQLSIYYFVLIIMGILLRVSWGEWKDVVYQSDSQNVSIFA